MAPEPSEGTAYPPRGEVTASEGDYQGAGMVHVRVGNRNQEGYLMNWADLSPADARELADDLRRIADQVGAASPSKQNS